MGILACLKISRFRVLNNEGNSEDAEIIINIEQTDEEEEESISNCPSPT